MQNHHVEEAIRLFKFSTMNAVAAGSADGLSRGELNEEMQTLEKDLQNRLPMGWSTSYQAGSSGCVHTFSRDRALLFDILSALDQSPRQSAKAMTPTKS